MGRIHADLFAFLKRHPVGRLLIPCICPSQFCPAQLETYLAAKFCMQQATQGLKKQDKDNNHQIINFALLLLETDLVNYACKIVSIVVGTVDVCICEAFRLKVLATTGCCLHTDEGTEAFIRLQRCPTFQGNSERYPDNWRDTQKFEVSTFFKNTKIQCHMTFFRGRKLPVSEQILRSWNRSRGGCLVWNDAAF